MSVPRRIVLGITGGSGAMIAVRLLQTLVRSDAEVHLTVSPSGAAVIEQELGFRLDLNGPDLDQLLGFVPDWGVAAATRELILRSVERQSQIRYHRYDDYITPIASGSFLTEAMVVCPCSGTTMSGIARAAAANLIQRAAEVHLKERRKLILVPRETPLSTLALENMYRVSQAGAVVLPAMPGWYQRIDGVDSLIEFLVSRILDQLGIDNQLVNRWCE